MEFLFHLWPDFLLQFLLGVLVLFVFAPSSALEHAPSKGKLLFLCSITSVVMLLLSLSIEHYVSPLILQSSLVIQWVFFTLLGHRICGIPLGKSMLSQFCYFSMILGVGLLSEHVLPVPSTPSDPPAPESWMKRVEWALLTNRLPHIRGDVLTALYGKPVSSQPPPSTKPPQPPPPTPTPAPRVVELSENEPPNPTEDPTLPPQEEVREIPPPVPPTPTPEPTPVPPDNPPEPSEQSSQPLRIYQGWPEPLPEATNDLPDVITGEERTGLDQISDPVNMQNQSTDSRYAPPDYSISAVSMGERGRFVMVDGRLLREGAVLTTGGSEPRGWKLFKVTETVLFWQPLE